MEGLGIRYTFVGSSHRADIACGQSDLQTGLRA